MLNLMVLFVFSVLKRKYLSWAYLVQKNYEQYEIFFGPEIPSFGRTWSTKSKLPVQDEIDFPEFDGNVHFFYFGPETPFMGITGRKKSELYQILSNILNWMMKLIFLFWTGNTIFWANFLHQIKRFYLT